MSGQFYPVKMIEQFFDIDAKDVISQFDILFDETKELDGRIQSFIDFNAAYLPKLREVKPDDNIENHYHGDLRAISLYLTLQYPEKYFLYKHSMNKAFAEVFELPNIKGGQVSNYERYLSLCNEILDFIKSDSAFIALYKEFCSIPGHYSDDYLHLLVQDFIYSIGSYLRPSAEVSYWIFQCNPDMFDLKTGLNEDLVNTWTVTAHKDKIREGDKVIIWMTGSDAGCYALAEVTSEPHKRLSSPDDQLWKKEDQSELKADINITHNLVASPVLKDAIDSIDEHIDLKAGNQGTNFIATKEQYETILDIIESSQSNVYSKIKNAFDQEKLESFLKMIRSFVKSNNLRYDDKRISFNVRKNNNRLVFIIGFRYAASISIINNKTELSFISQKVLNDKFGKFVNRSGQVEAYWNSVEKYEGYEDIINEGLLTELNRNYKCPYRNLTNQEFINDIYQNEFKIVSEKLCQNFL
ncbi:MAG: EVE domain-containing protein [Saprospiraceae bacterium]|nr:EVE domain-containing protein [Saprospiraceae bacterium]